MKINYTITGSLIVDESTYGEEYENENPDLSWNKLLSEEKKAFIIELEESRDYEGIHEAPNSDVEFKLEIEL